MLVYVRKPSHALMQGEDLFDYQSCSVFLSLLLFLSLKKAMTISQPPHAKSPLWHTKMVEDKVGWLDRALEDLLH